MSKITIDLKDLDDLLCKYAVKDLNDLESRLNEELSLTRRLRCAGCADLEAKLAESEKDRLMWQEMYKSADKQNKSICETDIYPLQEENENYQKLINDICNKYRVVNLKELDEILQATNESLEASRKYLNEETSKRWHLEKQLEDIEARYISINQDKEITDIVIAEYVEEVKQLKQQLAEKENRIVELENGIRKIEDNKKEEVKQVREFWKQRYKKLDNEFNQDKIELLEKVRPSIKATIELAENRYQMKDQVDIIIDNLINELKEKK